jgi:hypothetical protein
MPTEPYISRNPGDSITAEDWNDLQSKIQDDIAKKVKDAVDAKTSVANADNAAKLENKSAKEVEDEAVEKALAVLPTRTGYKMIFKRLTQDDEKVIKHELKACPLVDVYQLDYFEVICAKGEDKEDQSDVFVNFYLYNSREQKLKFETKSIEIEPADVKRHPFKISFASMLDLFGVEYTETQSLDDLETEFWKKFFSGLNDEFDEDQYCHSPWFEKCCGEKRSVKTLKDSGAWDDIWFKMMPRKTINYLAGETLNTDGTPVPAPPSTGPTPAPTQIQVAHFDFDTLGIKLLDAPVYPTELPPEVNKDELKVMLLLKV